MIYLDSVAIQAQHMSETQGLSIYSANILAQWIIQSWTGVGSLAVELISGALHGTLLERYMCRLTLAYYMEGDVEKAWDDFVAVMDAMTKVETDTQCPICYEEIGEGVQLKCKHVYHSDCIDNWFINNKNCPICNQNV